MPKSSSSHRKLPWDQILERAWVVGLRTIPNDPNYRIFSYQAVSSWSDHCTLCNHREQTLHYRIRFGLVGAAHCTHAISMCSDFEACDERKLVWDFKKAVAT